MELKAIAFSCALVASIRVLPAAVVTNAWLSSAGGNVTNLVNWSFFRGTGKSSVRRLGQVFVRLSGFAEDGGGRNADDGDRRAGRRFLGRAL